nr:hypothetical protein [Lysinibacillus timonensis]
MLKKLFFTGTLVSLFSLIGCSNERDEEKDKTQSLVEEVKFDKNEIESLQTQNQFLNEQNQYLVTTIRQVIENLSDEEMLEFSQNQVVYELQVNGEPLPKNGQITISAGEVEILLFEEFLGYDFLPDEWLDKAKISGNYFDHLLDFDSTNWTQIGYDGTVTTARGYKTAEIKAGQQFSFNVTEELRERLNIDTNLIQIEVK